MYLLGNSGHDASDLYRSDDGAGTWTKLIALSESRDFPACAVPTQADDHGANLIMVAGGNRRHSELNTVELFDIDTNAWRSTGPMKQAREQLVLVTLPPSSTSRDDEAVAACGGYDRDTDITFDDCELYDITAKQWVAAPFKLDMPRKAFGMAVSQTLH